jgi:ABC-2 type transport system permease protein
MIAPSAVDSTSPKTGAQQNLWRYVWRLLRLQVVIQISAFRRAKLRRKIGTIAIGLLLLSLLGLVFFVSWQVLKAINSPQVTQIIGDMAPVMRAIPAIFVSGAFLGILLTSFGVLLQALYLAGDMDFLLSTPTPIRAVFLSKLLQAVLPNFSLICLFALPVLFGLGVSQHYTLLFYPLVLIVLGSLALAAAGISSLLVMLVVRIFPARRVAEVIGFVGAIISFFCSQSGNLARFSEPSPEQTTQALTMLERLDRPWSPLSWAGRGLIGIGEGNWIAGSGYTLLVLVLAGVMFFFALNTAERLYYNGWANIKVSKQRKRKVARSKTTRTSILKPVVTFFERNLPSALRAIIIKDWMVMRRDLRNLSQLITPLIFGVVYAFMLLRGGGEPPPGQGDAPDWFMAALTNAMVYANVGLSLFVSWMLTARLAGMGFSQEGKSYWLLKTAPINEWQLIASKFLAAFLPVLVLAWIFLIVVWLLQGGTFNVLLFSLPVVALSIAGNVGINLAFGIQGANMKWTDPRHMQGSGSGCLASLISLLYLPLSLLLFFGPAVGLELLGLSATIGQWVGLALGGAFSVAFAVIPLWLVRKRIPRLGED